MTEEDAIKRLLDVCCTRVVELSNPDRHRLQQAWRSVYAQRVKQETGKWKYRGYDWHAFSHRFSVAREGAEAALYYANEKAKKIVIIPEEERRKAFECESVALPDFSTERIDVYVFPPTLDWTMVFTHEDDCGPYFSRSEWQSDR